MFLAHPAFAVTEGNLSSSTDPCNHHAAFVGQSRAVLLSAARGCSEAHAVTFLRLRGRSDHLCIQDHVLIWRQNAMLEALWYILTVVWGN
jgi:hypothetical protein